MSQHGSKNRELLNVKINNKITMPRPALGFDKNPQNINRKGAPKKDWTMASLIREAGEEAGETGIPRNKIIARKLAELAEKGDMQAIKEFNNRLDGMPSQSVVLTGDENKPLYVGLPSRRPLDTTRKTD